MTDLETLVPALEAHAWGYGTLDSVLAASEYDLNRDGCASWEGAPSHKAYYSFLLDRCRRSLAALVASQRSVEGLHLETQALVDIANATLQGTEDAALQEGVALLGLSEQQVRFGLRSRARACVCVCSSTDALLVVVASLRAQARQILSQSTAVAAESAALDKLSATLATVLASSSGAARSSAASPVGGALTRRGSRNSLSALESASPTASGFGEPLYYQFPLVEAILKRFHVTGLTPDQVQHQLLCCSYPPRC